MVKILLHIENYNEMSFLQTILKKVSFDVEICKNKAAINDVILTFNPEIIITTSRGQKVNGLELVKSYSQKAKKIDFFMVSNAGEDLLKLKEQGVIQGVLRSPINPRDLLSQIADLKGLDVNGLLSKYEKLTQKSQDSTSELVTGETHDSSPNSEIVRIKGKKVEKTEATWHSRDDKPENESDKEKSTKKKGADFGSGISSKTNHQKDREPAQGYSSGIEEGLSVNDEVELSPPKVDSGVEDQEVKPIESTVSAENDSEDSYEDDNITIDLINKISDEDRKKKNKEFMLSLEPLEKKAMPRAKIRNFNKVLRADESLQESTDHRTLKRQYVEAMLSNKDNK